jgi:hypothetical protein
LTLLQPTDALEKEGWTKLRISACVKPHPPVTLPLNSRVSPTGELMLALKMGANENVSTSEKLCYTSLLSTSTFWTS